MSEVVLRVLRDKYLYVSEREVGKWNGRNFKELTHRFVDEHV